MNTSTNKKLKNLMEEIKMIKDAEPGVVENLLKLGIIVVDEKGIVHVAEQYNKNGVTKIME